MLPWHLLVDQVDVYRDSSSVFSGTPVATTTMTVTLPQSAYMSLEWISATVAGLTVSFVGSSVEDIFIDSTTPWAQSSNSYTSLTGLTMTGTLSGTLKIHTRTRGGDAVNFRRTITTGLRARVEGQTDAWGQSVAGPVRVQRGLRMLCPYSVRLEPQDLVFHGQSKFRIESVLERRAAFTGLTEACVCELSDWKDD